MWWIPSFFKRKFNKEKIKSESRREWGKPFSSWEYPEGLCKEKNQQEFLDGIISSFSILLIIGFLLAIMAR